ncbi:MAG: ATP-dependent helicase HrpB [Deltaproteobacteria bacterium]|nr:ATP-dependent helicase HrpB [Deltaproteobacteria bacterium]
MNPVLPIDGHLAEIARLLRANPCLVLQAEPGAGKTTRVPPALVGLLGQSHPQVVVLEPRRLAARMAAERVAEEGGHALGGHVGFQVRFEGVTGPGTRVRFVTEGILARQLLSAPELPGVGAVVLDEFHERHIHGDLALALVRRLQRTQRPDLFVVVMSATLDALPVAKFLGDCPVMRVPGRVFPVDVEYADAPEPAQGGRHLDRQVADAFRRMLKAGLDGDVLVFLPGMAEIRRCVEATAALCHQHDVLCLPLHADLTPDEQRRAVRPAPKRKLILSTNVAETSVTIDGVVAVIDSGLARVPSHAAWSGLPVLRVARISRSSATQRAGRAGRTRPGRCVRLYTRHDHDTRPEHTPPEIRRLDLAETALTLHGAGETDLASFPFYEAPERSALDAAESLLRLLGAVTTDGALTELGARLVRFPLHPRQGRVLLEAAQRGLPSDGALLAAILGDAAAFMRGTGAAHAQHAHRCDALAAMDQLEAAASSGGVARGAERMGLDVGAVLRIDRVRRQLRGLVGGRDRGLPGQQRDEALQLALLTGYADRVGMRHGRGTDAEYLLATGGTARLLAGSAAAGSELLIALDVEERTGGRDSGVRIAFASGIELDWLLDAVPHLLEDVTEASWNAQAERVEAFSRLKLMQLVLEEKRRDRSDDPAVAALLARMALNQGPAAFGDAEELAMVRARVRLVAQHHPDAGLPDLTEDAVRETLRAMCEGCASFRELREAGLVQAVWGALSPAQQALVEREAPTHVRLPGGRRAPVSYVEGQPPWVASRLQDFFGQMQTPRIMGGRVPLNVHLLAPNQRAVQITNDLAGFWDRHYPAIRRELMRRYPRHSWPDDPRTAEPPAPRKR